MSDQTAPVLDKPTPAPAPAPRSKPGQAKKPRAKRGTGPKKAPALYHLFSQDEDGNVLTRVTKQEAKSAEQAVTLFVKEPGKHTKFANSVREGTASVVVVPERNYTVVGAEEEVKRTLKIKARK